MKQRLMYQILFSSLEKDIPDRIERDYALRKSMELLKYYDWAIRKGFIDDRGKLTSRAISRNLFHERLRKAYNDDILKGELEKESEDILCGQRNEFKLINRNVARGTSK